MLRGRDPDPAVGCPRKKILPILSRDKCKIPSAGGPGNPIEENLLERPRSATSDNHPQ
jgi:hypothetical protein